MSFIAPFIGDGYVSSFIGGEVAYDPSQYGFEFVLDASQNVTQGAANRVASIQSIVSGITFSQSTAGNRPETGLVTINGRNCISNTTVAGRWLSLDGATKAASIASLNLDFADLHFGVVAIQTAGVQSEALVGVKAAVPADIIISSYRATSDAYISGSAASSYIILADTAGVEVFPRGTAFFMELVVTGGEIIIYKNATEIFRQTSTLTPFDSFCLLNRVGNTLTYNGAFSDMFLGAYNASLFEANQEYYMNLAGL